MFEEVTKKQGGKNAARRATYVLGSTVFQIILVVAIVTASAAIKTTVVDEPVVDVKFVRAAPPPRPPPPPPPPPAPPAARKRPEQKPRTDLPKPPPPQALIQPQEIQAEMKPPDPNEPPEPEYDYGDTGEGVIGGVVGAPRQPEVEDAPAYATTGYRKPRMADPACVQRTVRLPPELLDFLEGSITVKFAIGKDGAPSRFEVMTSVHDQRIANAIWRAVQSCRWIPGADAQGTPVSIWVILPVRFTS